MGDFESFMSIRLATKMLATADANFYVALGFCKHLFIQEMCTMDPLCARHLSLFSRSLNSSGKNKQEKILNNFRKGILMLVKEKFIFFLKKKPSSM